MQKRFSFLPLPRTARDRCSCCPGALRMRWFFRLRNPLPNPTPLPGRLVLLPMHRPMLPANRRVFDAFLAHQFQESVQDDPLSLHFLVRNPENYGITEPEMKFPEYSLNSLKDSEENAVVLEELSSFDTSLDLRPASSPTG